MKKLIATLFLVLLPLSRLTKLKQQDGIDSSGLKMNRLS
jgi:hypothetical protein